MNPFLVKKTVISDGTIFGLPLPLGSVGKPDIVGLGPNKSVFS